MKRLLMVTTIPSTIRAFLLPLAQHFRSRGWRVDAASQDVSSSSECLRNFDRLWNVGWSRNPLDYNNFAGVARAIRGIVESEGYDLVHVHTPVAAFVTRAAIRNCRARLGVKVIYTAHGFHFYNGAPLLKNVVFLTLEKLAGRWTDYLVVMNRDDEIAAKRHRLVPPDHVFFMPGIGVDTDYYSPDNVSDTEIAALRSELGLGPEERFFLMVAEFIPRKRHRDVLLSFARLGPSDCHLALAGDGPLTADMNSLASQLGIGDRVHFLGFRRDIPALMRASTAVILASSQEGLPRSVMESMALGVPVLASDIRGVKDLLECGCGLLFPLGDVGGIAQAMRWVLSNPEEAAAMGRLGRAHIEQYDIRRIVSMHESLYARALGEPSTALPSA